jgi:hypothetical protein
MCDLPTVPLRGGSTHRVTMDRSVSFLIDGRVGCLSMPGFNKRQLSNTFSHVSIRAILIEEI